MNYIQINHTSWAVIARKPADNFNRGINTGIASGILNPLLGKNYQIGRN